MNTFLFNKLRGVADYLLMPATREKKSYLVRALAKLLHLHPTTRTLLLYRGGLIRKARLITENKRFSSAAMQSIASHIEVVNLALTDWELFVQQTDIPPATVAPQPFNRQVLMIVNSCAAYDQNGYAVRGTLLSHALDKFSINASFCARPGYPWDMTGRANLPIRENIQSDEGLVWLQHHSDTLIEQAGPDYWEVYAAHIQRVVQRLSIRPTILHAHSKYSNCIAAVYAGRQLGIPVVYEMRGFWHMTRAQREPTFAGSDLFQYEERMEVWAAELADAIVVISRLQKEWLVEHGVAADKITVIPNAPGFIYDNLPEPTSNRSDVLRLAFMGSLTAYEGIETVIQAVSLLVAQGVEVSFDVFGSGPGSVQSALEREVKHLNLKACVRFRGQVARSSIQECIQNFDIYPLIRMDCEVTRLIPPLKHLEPMAAGKVVLVSTLPALLEDVPPGVASHAVPPGDGHALAQKLLGLWNSPDELSRLAMESRQWVRKHRNWTSNAQRYRNLYENLTQTARHENNTIIQ